MVCTSNRFKFGTLKTSQRKDKLWFCLRHRPAFAQSQIQSTKPGPRIVLRVPLSPGQVVTEWAQANGGNGKVRGKRFTRPSGRMVVCGCAGAIGWRRRDVASWWARLLRY